MFLFKIEIYFLAGCVWSTSAVSPFFLWFVCVAGGLCVCVVEYLCVVDSLSVWATVDVCTKGVEHSRKKASTTRT